MNWENRTVVITGASSGIGEALARDFASRGANLVLLSRRKDRLEALAGELKPGKAKAYACDVSKDGAFDAILPLIRRDFSTIDVLIANAGFGVVGPTENLTIDDYRRQFETNVFGVIRTVQAMIPDLKKSRGSIAVVGSVNGYLALPGNGPYAMSKFAVRAFCDSLRHEMRPFGVSVTHIAPGFVESEIRRVSNQGVFKDTATDPIPPFLQMPAKVAARKIARAIACRRRERVVTAHGYWAVWLERHLPAVVDALLRFSGLKARREPKPLEG